MADIPGIIEGASEGRGLGLRFLRHIERNSLLLFLVPADADDIHSEYKILLNELAQYNPELLDKRRVLAVSKSDMLDEELMQEMSKDLPEIPHIFISSITNFNIQLLKDLLWKELNKDGDYRKTTESLIHRKLDLKAVVFEDDDAYNVEDDYDEDEIDEDENDWNQDNNFDQASSTMEKKEKSKHIFAAVHVSTQNMHQLIAVWEP